MTRKLADIFVGIVVAEVAKYTGFTALIATVVGFVGLWIDNLPFAYSILVAVLTFTALIFAFATLVWISRTIKEPPAELQPELQQKRALLQKLFAYSYQLPETTSFFHDEMSSALNEIKVVFAGDSDVMEELNKLQKYGGSHQLILAQLVKAMSESAKIKVDVGSFETPFAVKKNAQADQQHDHLPVRPRQD